MFQASLIVHFVLPAVCTFMKLHCMQISYQKHFCTLWVVKHLHASMKNISISQTLVNASEIFRLVRLILTFTHSFT